MWPPSKWRTVSRSAPTTYDGRDPHFVPQHLGSFRAMQHRSVIWSYWDAAGGDGAWMADRWVLENGTPTLPMGHPTPTPGTMPFRIDRVRWTDGR